MTLPKRDTSSNTARRIRGAKAFQSGLEAENTVIAYFQKKGFTVLTQRTRTPFGEIDLMISNDNWLIGVEVKQRRTLYESAFALTPKQSSRLLGAFDYLINLHPEWSKPNTRFDVALVDKAGKIDILEDALRLF